MFFFLSFLLIFPVWLRGGTRLEMMGPAPWLALAALVGMLFNPPLKNQETLSIARARVWNRFLSDPLLYVGLAFLFMLILQWSNGPCEELFDVPSWSWIFGPPPRPGLPLFCINQDEALEMLHWFFPFYAALLVIRNGFLRSQKLDLLKLLAVNAGLAAVFGLVQYLSGTQRIYWLTTLKSQFFAAFGYSNHAGAFFVLVSVLAAGLLLRSLLKKERNEEWPWLASVLLVCMLAAVFSRSRAAILMTGFLVAAGAAYSFLRLGRKHSARGMATALVCVTASVVVAVCVIAVVPDNLVKAEMKGTTVEEVESRVDTNADTLKAAAWKIWGEHTWFGVGGWGYRHYLPHVVPKEEQKLSAPGGANVHNDPLQFLTEFGVVGAGLLVATIVLLVFPAIRAVRRIRPPDEWDNRSRFIKIPPLGLALLVGPCLTLAHSLGDLPFRSPAILWLWGAMLACASDFCERVEPHRRHRRAVAEVEPAEGEPAEADEAG